MVNNQSGWKKHLGVAAAIFIVGSAVYANGLGGGFMVDDHAFFDSTARSPGFLMSHFVPDREEALGVSDAGPRAYYRPLAHIVPNISYLMFGNQVAAHHIVNLLLWMMAAGVIYFLVLASFSDWRLAAAAALGCLVHPVNGLQVNYITASVFSVQLIGMGAGLWCVARMAGGRDQGRWTNNVLWAGAVLGMVTGLLCHETALAFPFYAAALVFVIRSEGALSHRAIRAGRISAVFFVLAAVYFLWRLRFASLNRSILMNFAILDMNLLEYAASVSRLMLWYLGKLFVPRGIVLTYAMPVVRQDFAAWLIVLAALVCSWAWLVRTYRKDPPALLGLLWLALGFPPFFFATVFQPVHGLWMEPHWFVFSSTGFFIFLARLLTRQWPGRRIFRKVTWSGAAAAVILILWGWTSALYNRLWSDEIVYCRYWLEESPGFAGAQISLARAYDLRRDYRRARPLYYEVIRRNFRPGLAYTNLGVMDIMEGRWEEAREHLNRAMAFPLPSAVTLANLAVVAFKDQDLEQAETFCREAIRINPFLVLPRLNLAKVMLALNRRADAVMEFESILKIDPQHEITLMELLQLHVADQNPLATRETAMRLLRTTRDPKISRFARSALVLPANFTRTKPESEIEGNTEP